MYPILKHLHMTMALLTFLSFFVRGIWMWRQSPLLHKRIVKILPHIIDTVLLVCAIALALVLSLSPMNQPWLMAKLMALVVYIGLGVVAIKHAKPMEPSTRWIATVVVFLYILSVAQSKDHLVFFG